MCTVQFPDDGELFLSTNKKHNSIVFFVHFFKGNKRVLKRHIEMVNELGYDAYAFTLNDNLKKHYYLPYSPISKKVGMKHALADQIENHFKAISALYNSVIVFSFSNVTGSTIEMMYRHFTTNQNKPKILALITDSGPGSQIIKSSYNLLKEQFKIKSLILRTLTTPLFASIWSQEFHKDLNQHLKNFPDSFPILSIRGWRDKLISPNSIDDVFEPHKNLNWKKLSLPEAGHLNGLRDFPNEYKPSVSDFLTQIENTYN